MLCVVLELTNLNAKIINFFVLLDAAEAVKIQKDKKKLSNKRRQEFLQEQKQKRVARLQHIQSTRLPDDVLNSLTDAVDDEHGQQPSTNVKTSTSKSSSRTERPQRGQKKVFDSDAEDSDGEEEEDGQANYLSLDTKATKFEVVTPRDLNSGNKFRNAEAWTFRNKMLNDPRRVRREDHRSNRVQLAKRAAGGKDGFVRAAATT